METKRNALYCVVFFSCRFVWFSTRIFTVKIFEYILPITGANRHELPISGRPFGPGTSEYGRICEFFDASLSIISGIFCDGAVTSFGKILIADENAVRFTSELAAVRVPILNNFIHSSLQIFSQIFCLLPTDDKYSHQFIKKLINL